MTCEGRVRTGREGGRTLLVSETTYELARAAGLDGGMAVRDAVSLRGRREPVRVFGMVRLADRSCAGRRFACIQPVARR